MKDIFRKVAHRTAELAGSSWAFLISAAVIVTWAVSGPMFQYSDSWQLVINTGTTIVTFLMVFLIQNTQNRESKAVQLKLDELIKSTHAARNGMIALENMNDEELKCLEEEFEKLRARAAPEKVITASDKSPDLLPETVQ